MKCGLRTSYVAKKGYSGENRHMGPAPHTIRHVMESLEKDTKAEDVNEKIVNGRLMEAQGRILQMGVTNTMAINMSFADYMKRMGYQKPSTLAKGSKMQSPTLTTEIQEAATTELINHLETTAAGQASSEAVELVKKAAQSLQSTAKAACKMKAKAAPKKKLDVTSSPEWEMAGTEDMEDADQVHVVED